MTLDPNPHWVPEQGEEVRRLNDVFGDRYVVDVDQRRMIFETAERILGHAPRPVSDDTSRTGLALGYVQSGKTMSFTALTALAADAGYRVVVAFLGSTNLLLDQNRSRLEADLEIETRTDYRWIPLPNLGSSSPVDEAQSLDRYLSNSQRAVLITVLKHAGRITVASEVLRRSNWIRDVATLVIDDEADQASLNTRVRQGDVSSTYNAILQLREPLGRHLYIQYTATPFAPLLLEARDQLSPDFVEMLYPGPDYTGGESFFLESRRAIIREVTDPPIGRRPPAVAPEGLLDALRSFFAGAALQASHGRSGPISMLIHPSHLNTIHAQFKSFVDGIIQGWRTRVARPATDPGRAELMADFARARQDLVLHGAEDVADDAFEHMLANCLNEGESWLVNSAEGLDRIPWARSPVHILIGGNKLGRGFTVRGLTVTYMPRTSRRRQADTIEQRARSFGYKRPYLEYCRFYAPADVLEAFTSLVHTEADMRARLLEWVAEGRPIRDWAAEVGLALPAGIDPTRANVIESPSLFLGAGWHTLRRPDLSRGVIENNFGLLQELGFLDGELVPFGDSVRHRVVNEVDASHVMRLLSDWELESSPGWQHDRIVDYVWRRMDAGALSFFDIVLIEAPNGRPRVRGWREPGGIVNLMQGEDAGTRYPGDYYIHRDRPQVQVHRVLPRLADSEELHTLALYIPADEEHFPSTVGRQGPARPRT